MSELVRFDTTEGAPLLIEVDSDSYGMERIARRGNGVVDATQTLEEALRAAAPTVRAVVQTIKDLAPDEHEIEFGIKLNAELGVVVAKSALEGHFTVKLRWKSS